MWNVRNAPVIRRGIRDIGPGRGRGHIAAQNRRPPAPGRTVAPRGPDPVMTPTPDIGLLVRSRPALGGSCWQRRGATTRSEDWVRFLSSGVRHQDQEVTTLGELSCRGM